MPDVDAAPEPVPGRVLSLGTASSLADCEGRCAAEVNCTIFTHNHHTHGSDNCNGYVGLEPVWRAEPNPHCTSGCLVGRVRGCAAPPPPSPWLPRWTAPQPSHAKNASEGYPVIGGATHVTVHTATPAFGTYNHGQSAARDSTPFPSARSFLPQARS